MEEKLDTSNQNESLPAGWKDLGFWRPGLWARRLAVMDEGGFWELKQNMRNKKYKKCNRKTWDNWLTDFSAECVLLKLTVIVHEDKIS